MQEAADIVIIGAGINGVSAAWHLARRGAGRIVVLERAGLAAAATGKSGALVRCHYTNVPETQLAVSSLEYFRNWDDVVGGSCGYQEAGFMALVPEGREAELRHNVAFQRQAGVNTSIITHEEALELDPELDLSGIGGIAWEPETGYCDPLLTTRSFARAAADLGVDIRQGTRVLEILRQGERITGVRTDAGVINAGKVLVAAGAWATKLLDPLGHDDIGLIPTATSVALFRWPDGRSGRHPTYIDHSQSSWFRPVDGHSTLIGTELGAVTGIDPDGYPELPTQDYVELCREKLVRRLPRMQHAVMRGGWTGVIMRSEDSHPVIGRLQEGLYVMSGDNGSCFKTAPAIGKCLSELMLDGRATTVDLTPFRAERFREGNPWVDTHRYTAGTQTISR